MHLSAHDDETSELSHWHVPQAHFLESVERRARVRRHRLHRAAAHRAALRRPHRRTRCSPSCSATPEQSAYDMVREHWIKARTGTRANAARRLRAALAALAARRRGAGHRAARQDRSTLRRGCGRGAPRRAAGDRPRDRLPPRPDGPRRPVRQQRLAAGAAQADHQAHVGQRRARQPARPPSSSASTARRRCTAASTAASSATSSSCAIERPHGPRRDLRSPATPTTASPCISATAARAPARSAPASASTPTRCAPPTRCRFGARRRDRRDRRARIRWPARSITT